MTMKLVTAFLFGTLLLTTSCTDLYEWAQNTPPWLGSSIYDELDSKGEYTIYLKMVNELGKADFLKKTGSVTVFVADDAAYRRYFEAHGFDENNLTASQKKTFVYSTMLANAFVLELLTNKTDETNSTVKKGQVMRRDNTSSSMFDFIPTFKKEELPTGSVSHDWWKDVRNSSQTEFNILTDETKIPMVHFIWKQMQTKGITKSDFSYLFNGTTFNNDDVYINNVQVEEGNITCQNGYIHKMSEVAVPLKNMAEFIRTSNQTGLFSKFIERFSMPVLSTSITSNYKTLQEYYADQHLYDDLVGNDSIYVKRYFWSNGTQGLTTFGDSVTNAFLRFDPGSNSYVETGSKLDEDMGAMFVPTDQALTDYWNSQDGAFLRNRYPSSEPFGNVPDNVLVDLINNHMQYSFLASLPSQFENVLDDSKDPIGITTNDIDHCYVACNGGVYVTKKVFAPASFRSVIAPTLVEENMKIMNWAIKNLEFKPYLLSMVSYYSFLILTDKALSSYIDPVTYKSADPRWLKFYYDNKSKTVQAYSYSYNKKLGGLAGCTETNMRMLNSTLEGTKYTPNTTVTNRLTDLLNYCIIPRNTRGGNIVGDGTSHFQTKDNGTIQAVGSKGSTTFHNELTNEDIPVLSYAEKGNGAYFVLDKMMEPTFKSLEQLLASRPEYSEFYNLLQGNDEWTTAEINLYAILKRSGTYYSMNDDNSTVKMFNTYHYTVYIPDNTAMAEAYSHGLPRWSDINHLDELYANTEVNVAELKKNYTEKLIKFLKYHFQDNALFVGGEAKNGKFESSAVNENTGLFYTINANENNDEIALSGNYTPAWWQPVTIKKTDNLVNQLVREYSFTGETIGSTIATSSYAVIQGIGSPLLYDPECLCLKNTERYP